MYDKNYVLVGGGKIYYEVGTVSLQLGYYLGGVRLQLRKDIVDLTKADVLGTYERKKIGERLEVSTVLLEASIQNLFIVWNGYGTASDWHDDHTLSVGGQPQEDPFQLKLEGPGPNGGTRTVTIFKVTAVDPGEHIQGSKRNVWAVPVKFSAMHDETRSIGARLYQVVDTSTTWTGI